MENSKIEWCTHTANLWIGCSPVHKGCDHCYAEALSHRWGNDLWGNDKPRRFVKTALEKLYRFQKLAQAAEAVHTVFVGSMMDIFENPMPVVDAHGIEFEELNTGHLRNRLFSKIMRGDFPNLFFLFLTKRGSNINKYIPEFWKTNSPKNVMFGVSISDQQSADTLIPQLLKVRGNKFLSIEPLLDEVDLHKHFSPTTQYDNDENGGILKSWEYEAEIDWVIVGGESGHHKRPFDANWARSIKSQCQSARVPFFMKQIDKVQPIPQDLMVREFPEVFNFNQVTK